MVRLFVLSSGGSVFDWLVVRFCGDKDGVKGHRGTCSERLSKESSPLPLELKDKMTANAKIREQHIDFVPQVQLTSFLFTVRNNYKIHNSKLMVFD